LVRGLVTAGAGVLNEFSVGPQRGITLAVDDLNAAGGVLGGPVEWISAAEAADRTMDDVVAELQGGGATASVGTVGSDSAPEMQRVMAQLGSITCSASATRPSLTEPEGAPSFFRTAIRDDAQAAFIADEIMTPAEGEPPGRVVVVGRDDTYGTEFAGALTAELAARGAETVVVSYPSRRVQLEAEGAEVAAAAGDVVVAIAAGEAPRLLAAMIDAGVPANTIVGLDGMYVPRIAEQTFPENPARLDGLTVIATTGDRAFASRLEAVPASQDQVSYGAQMYDCAVTMALAAAAAGSADPAAISTQIRAVTSGGRVCSNPADCLELLAANEDIDFDGATGGIAIDENGDVTTARITTLRVADATLQEVAAEDVDLVALAQQDVYAAALFTSQIQQTLKLLGLYEGPVTGIWDQATTDAVVVLQRQLGVPETGQWDEATDAAFRARYGDFVGGLSTSITSIQLALTELGLYTGPIDGRWSAELSESIRALQRQLGVPETGVVDLATLRALYAANAPEPAPTTVATTTPPPTQPPPTQPPPTQPPPTPPPPTDPPATEPPATEPPTTEPLPPAGDTLYDVLANDDERRFTTLLQMLTELGYTELDRPGVYTVFAPTNAAFDAANIEGIPANELLAYHVAQGIVVDADLLTSSPLEMIHGGSVTITQDGEDLRANDAAIIEELPASNGVIHVIDGVLIPPG
jgi:branched-chain amino acid transport system substrate-binding protein